MGIEKTDEDIHREDVAHAYNADLIGSRMKVIAGDRPGSYLLIVDLKSEAELVRAIEAIRVDYRNHVANTLKSGSRSRSRKGPLS